MQPIQFNGEGTRVGFHFNDMHFVKVMLCCVNLRTTLENGESKPSIKNAEIIKGIKLL